MTDISPMSRDEKLLRRALGQSIETEPPQSRIEFLLQEIIDGGGIGTGSYKIKDQYATLAELEAAHPVGEDGDAYLVGDPTHIYVWLDDRQEYADGGLFAAVPGLDGVGITSIEKTATAGLVDTYTITYTDGDTDTFTVTNGAQGEPGEDGEDGVGITSIVKSGTVGNVDTYTITLTDGSTYNFTVTNGEGIGVPEGGTTGQVLVKKSNTDYDTEWANAGAGEGVPAGGTTGQILAKKTGADYDTEWVDNEGGSDVTSEIESLSAAASELASETGSLSTENSTQTSEINSLSSEYNSLSSEISSNTSDISSLSQSMSELASAAASQSTSQSQIDSTQDVALASLSTENSTQTSEIGSMASEMASMSVSDITSQLSSLSTENSTQESEIGSLAATDSTHTSELSSLSQSMSEMAAAASSTSTAQSELDSEQDVSLASLSTENSTQTSEIGSLSTASSELASEVEVIGSEVAEKQDALVEGPGIDIDATTNEIKTEMVLFTGTTAEWEALSLAEKTQYTHAAFTNDEQTGIVDQVPTEGSNHLVTSGGVYQNSSFSTSEIETSIEFNGRKVYRRTFRGYADTYVTYSALRQFNAGLMDSGVEEVINAYGMIEYGQNNYEYQIPSIAFQANGDLSHTCHIRHHKTEHSVSLMSESLESTNIQRIDYVVTVEYTKTT